LGCWVLIPACEGSNPSSSAKHKRVDLTIYTLKFFVDSGRVTGIRFQDIVIA
jgi:hypothetical protein